MDTLQANVLPTQKMPEIIGKIMVPLGWYPSCLTPQRAVKGGNKYPLYTVYMGVMLCIFPMMKRHQVGEVM